MQLEERPSEPVIVFMGDKTSAGAFNLPLYKMFARPVQHAGTLHRRTLEQGFLFEVQGVKEHKQITLGVLRPYDLLTSLSTRYQRLSGIDGGDHVARKGVCAE